MGIRKILGVFPMRPGSGWKFRVMVELGGGYGRRRSVDVLCGGGRVVADVPGGDPGVEGAVRDYLDRRGIIV